jgi:hypothetical protein
LEKAKRGGNELDYDSIKNKFRTKNGTILGYGLTIIPT